MQEKGDEPVVKLAKNFIENCKDFEVRELQQKEQTESAGEPRTEQTDDLRVVRYDDYIKTCIIRILQRQKILCLQNGWAKRIFSRKAD